MALQTQFKSGFDSRMATKLLGKTFISLIEFMPDVNAFAKDRDGRFLFVNQNFADKCGLTSPGNIVGLTDLDVWPKSLGEKYRKDDAEILLNGHAKVDVIELITAVGQEAQWYSTTKIPIMGNLGNVLGVAGFSRNMKMAPIKPGPGNIITAARDYIVTEYGKPFDVQELASRFFLSISQFERRFKAAYKMSPRKYITMIRIQAACHALSKTDEQIFKIARDCGFYDVSHLNHQFKREMNITPREYRKAYS